MQGGAVPEGDRESRGVADGSLFPAGTASTKVAPGALAAGRGVDGGAKKPSQEPPRRPVAPS